MSGTAELADRDPAVSAFSRQSSVFDGIDAANPVIGWMRERVRERALRYMRPGDHVLELNAGTGIDSFYFARLGMHVLATDAATGMVERLRAKCAVEEHLPVEVMQLSFLDLPGPITQRFDHVFSDFGGLNCTPHIDQVMRGIDAILKPGGICTLVIMPRFCPWEVLSALKGNFYLACRRWRKGGTMANVEGVRFACHYHSTRSVKKALGPFYDVLDQRALALLVPPPHHPEFPSRWPRTFRVLAAIEDRIAGRWPFRNWGDHFLITLRKRS